MLQGSYVIEKCHEAEVHVQLLVTVKECQPWVVRDEVDFGFLVATQHHDIFQDSRCCLSRHAREFKAMPVQVYGVDVITGIAHANSIALSCFQMK